MGFWDWFLGRKSAAPEGRQETPQAVSTHLEAPPAPAPERPNRLELIIGPPGSGKTTLGRRLCELARVRKRLVLVHDPHRQYRYPVVSPGEVAARVEKLSPVDRAFALSCDCGAVIDLALELGKRWNDNRPVPLQPIYLFLDEASYLDSSGPSYVGPRERLLLSNRRHYGIEVGVNMQRPTQLMVEWWDGATAAFLFRCFRADARRAMEQRLGFEKGMLEDLKALPPHRYAGAKQGVPRPIDPRSLLVP